MSRKRRTIDLPPALIVVCEGGTEEQLIKDLRGRWRIEKRAVYTEAAGRQTVELLNRAKALRQEKGRRGRLPETWVAFDADGRADWSRAVREAGEAGIRLAVSNPCFEQWALLLHRDQRRHLHHHDAQRLLRGLHPGYDHDDHPYLDVGTVLAHLADARRRSMVINRAARRLGEPYRNPMTLFSDLIERLEELR